ncbi:YbgA family protein [Ferrimonas lipolytica]|uniref:DUF523 and DUF1722 domain-containing protein n=1 Tax=Ferrimonas lipolytica TaxID=2724191 RepID=A0A6H1UCP7_9GAMM|nr:DUF523 and DUF1722 domain-containing protein [Ferrimonas lipolytica]QIZ76841.1 DUF523 and DUF1722 domain-containing protein [Ferrimonas lipolytica]
MTQSKPVVGVSACVIGEEVRYDSGHKRSVFVDTQLRQLVSFKPICPEVGIGLTVPRPTIRLRWVGESIRLMDDKNHIDHTDKMVQFNNNILPSLEGLSGYVVCAKSPTCGMERVKVLQEDTKGAEYKGRGLFTKALMERYPLLPVEEDGRLNDQHLRENFVLRVLIFQQAQQLLAAPSQAKLQSFHQQHKLLLLAHNQTIYRQLGPLVAEAFDGDSYHKTLAYVTLMMTALAKPANRKGHTNALQHIQGYFKKDLDSAEKKHLEESILAYRNGRLPLMAPLSIVNHILSKYPKPYIIGQSYLEPTPEQLALRCNL